MLAAAQASDKPRKPQVPSKEPVKTKTYSEQERNLAKGWLVCAETSDAAIVLAQYAVKKLPINDEFLSPRIIRRFAYLSRIYRLYANVILGEREANRFYYEQYNEDIKLAKQFVAMAKEIVDKKNTIKPEQLVLFNKINDQIKKKDKATMGCTWHFLNTAQPYEDFVPEQYSLFNVFKFIGQTNPIRSVP